MVCQLTKIYLSAAFIFFVAHVFADTRQIQEQIAANITNSVLARPQCADNLRCSSGYTKQFYQMESSNPIWSHDGVLVPDADKLLTILSNSYQDGLNPQSYHIKNIKSLLADLSANSYTESAAEKITILADLDATLTDAFFSYTYNLAYGKINNKQVYPSWIVIKRSVDLPAKLNEAATKGNIQEVLDGLTPHYPEYSRLKQKLGDYQQIVLNGGWRLIESGPKLQLGDYGKRVSTIQRRLFISGDLKKINKNGSFDQDLKQAVIRFQISHGLKGDGVAGNGTIQAMNISARMRTQQIELNMDRLRWLPGDLGRRYIMVNIPDYSLTVVDQGKIVMSMPVIVGKDKGLQSCVLSSRINYLELNPYWYIPQSIAVKDILPKLKKDANYLTEKDMKIFADYTSSPLSPEKIKWSKIEAQGFSYKIRQNPGQANPLGRVKFVFPNSCGIYLHDTSAPELFKKSKRAFSHGCIRIGKPIELATYLLAGKPGWDKGKIINTINSGENKLVTLVEPINIDIVYATAWVDQDDVLQFRNDIYNVDNIPYTLALPPM